MSDEITRGGDDSVDDGTETSGPGDLQVTRTSLPTGPAGAEQPLPETIGRYRIVSKIGEGGMGVVYEAEQPEPRRRVALKVIRGGSFVDDNRVRMFQREAETLVVESTEAILDDARAHAGLKKTAIERAVRLYEQWGRAEAAEAWRQRL